MKKIMKVRFRGVENCKKRVPLDPDTFDQVLKEIQIFQYHPWCLHKNKKDPHQLPQSCGEFRCGGLASRLGMLAPVPLVLRAPATHNAQ